jgi:nucleoside-diphosphate-sugar epimerase
MENLVVGATGIVGGYIVEVLLRSGERPFALSRSPPAASTAVRWLSGDLQNLGRRRIPPVATIYCTAPIGLFVKALPLIATGALKRVVVFTSTSIVTKVDSDLASERQAMLEWATAEQELIAVCAQLGVEYTILRPTIIYDEGRDRNVSRLAEVVRKVGFFPLSGNGGGLRQPVHAEDLAIGAVRAARTGVTGNKIYALPGTETITYREMVGRIFDGLGRPRRIVSVPPVLWRLVFLLAKPLFPNSNRAMGSRMAKDMIFDASPAIKDFGWVSREFRPSFDVRRGQKTLNNSAGAR